MAIKRDVLLSKPLLELRWKSQRESPPPPPWLTCRSPNGPRCTDHGLDGPGIESRWGEIFRTCPDRPWGPSSLLYSGYRVFPGGKERPGRDADPSPPSSAVGHERVELYLYSPCGPYSLYRAAVPVQGCTLPYLYFLMKLLY